MGSGTGAIHSIFRMMGWWDAGSGDGEQNRFYLTSKNSINMLKIGTFKGFFLSQNFYYIFVSIYWLRLPTVFMPELFSQ
jgi:hypothetical protein